MIAEKTTLLTWNDLLAVDPSLSEVDALLTCQKPHIRASTQWGLYCRAKAMLSRYVGWNATHAPEELATSEAYEIGIDHICNTLGI